MEINKQLFEDVLSGKLKGTFVTRNGWEICSDRICRNTDDYYSCKHEKYCYPYMDAKTHAKTYTIFGRINELYTYDFDIIDFIPDTNMKENELTIEIPDNKVVDWDESKKQNKIVLKNKQLTYEDVCKKLFSPKHFYINDDGIINQNISSDNDEIVLLNNASTKHQLECILAKNMLANVATYLNNGWKPDKTDLGHFDAWVLFMTPDKDSIGWVKIINCANSSNVLFKSKELAQKAIEILGEETVKLALEPLGI